MHTVCLYPKTFCSVLLLRAIVLWVLHDTRRHQRQGWPDYGQGSPCGPLAHLYVFLCLSISLEVAAATPSTLSSSLGPWCLLQLPLSALPPYVSPSLLSLSLLSPPTLSIYLSLSLSSTLSLYLSPLSPSLSLSPPLSPRWSVAICPPVME